MTKIIQEQNSIINEEFKIWKKSTPLIYDHITTYKPLFIKDSGKGGNEFPSLHTFTFDSFTPPSPSKFPNSGVSTSTVYYTEGKILYSLDINLPNGLLTRSEQSQDKDTFSLPLASEEALKVPNDYRIINAASEHDYLKIQKTSGDHLMSLDTNNTISWNNCLSGSVDRSYKCQLANFEVTDFETFANEKLVTSCGEVVDYNSGKQCAVLEFQNSDESPDLFLKQAPKFVNTNQLVAINNKGVSLDMIDIRDSKSATACVSSNNDSRIVSFDHSAFAQTLYITGSSDGVVRLWDSRMSSEPLHSFQSNFYTGSGGVSAVSKVKFNPTSPMEFLSVCSHTGFIYQWDMEPLVSQQRTQTSEGTEKSTHQALDYEEVSSACLKYVHTSGSRRKTKISKLSKSLVSRETQIAKTQCEWNPHMSDVIGCLDLDGTLVVYKGWFGRVK